MVMGTLGWRCWGCGVIFTPFVNHPDSAFVRGTGAVVQGSAETRGGSGLPRFIL